MHEWSSQCESRTECKRKAKRNGATSSRMLHEADPKELLAWDIELGQSGKLRQKSKECIASHDRSGVWGAALFKEGRVKKKKSRKKKR